MASRVDIQNNIDKLKREVIEIDNQLSSLKANKDNLPSYTSGPTYAAPWDTLSYKDRVAKLTPKRTQKLRDIEYFEKFLKLGHAPDNYNWVIDEN